MVGLIGSCGRAGQQPSENDWNESLLSRSLRCCLLLDLMINDHEWNGKVMRTSPVSLPLWHMSLHLPPEKRDYVAPLPEDQGVLSKIAWLVGGIDLWPPVQIPAHLKNHNVKFVCLF